MSADWEGYDERFSIGRLARRTGYSIDTIRYYERIALMPTVERTGGGHRLYGGHHVRRLAFIRHCRTLGLSLDQVRDLLGDIESRAYGCEEFRALLARCAAGIRRRIDELCAIETNLRTVVEACGEPESANCALIEAMLAGDDTAAAAGCASAAARA